MTDEVLSKIFESKYIEKERNEILLQSIIYVAKIPDKSIRPQFMRALNYWFKTPKDKFDVINNIMLIKQSRRAVCVDLEENRQFRQNIATANATYSVADALGACVYGTYIEMENMAKIWPFEDFNKTKLIVKPEVEFYRGRGMEIDWMNNAECPTEEEYFKAAVRKTGSTIEFMIQMMQLFSTNQADFTRLAQILGKFFHVYDDYINLKSMDGYLMTENNCNTISQGKFSFPVIHAIRSHQDDVQMIRQKPTTEEILKYSLHLLEEFGSFEYTRQTLRMLKNEAEEEMNKFEENPYILQLFEDIFIKLKID
ncbi:unnamed protein product [Tenebrio molitor]|nr:unnamed protein product [Tenebrio molitor]